jgi:O-methyltransferase involved in polyketide biosynthesis
MQAGDAAADKPKGDLSITALYTSQTWAWGGLDSAGLLATPEAKVVFRVTNAALLFARIFMRNLPSLRHSLLHRHAMIDHLLRVAVAEAAAPPQVVELASGLSRRGATFSADPTLRYVEVDLPHVVAKKRELFARTEEGRQVVQRANLTLVGADVAQADLDQQILADRRLVVIAEGLFMYLTPDAQRLLWAKVRRWFDIPTGGGSRAGEGLFVFDLVPACEQPPPGRVGRALEAMMKRFTGGRSFERDQRTRADIATELGAAGFGHVEIVAPRDVAHAWALPFADTPTQQLLFVCRPTRPELA